MAVKVWSILLFLASTTPNVEAVRVDDHPADQTDEVEEEVKIPHSCKPKTGTVSCEEGLFGRPHRCKIQSTIYCCKNACPEVVGNPFAEDDLIGTGSTHNGVPNKAEAFQAKVKKDKEAKDEDADAEEGEKHGEKKDGTTIVPPTNSGIAQKRMLQAGQVAYATADCPLPTVTTSTMPGASTRPAYKPEDEPSLLQGEDDPIPPAKGENDSTDPPKNENVKMHPYELKERLDDIKANHRGPYIKWANSHIPQEEILLKQHEEEIPESPEEDEQWEMQKAAASGKMHPYEVKERIEAIEKDHKGPWNKWSSHMTQVKSDYKPRS